MASAEKKSESWEVLAAKKSQECKQKIPKQWLLPKSFLSSELQLPLETKPNNILKLDIPRRSGILTKREISITEDYTVPELLTALAGGSLSSAEVTTAFSKRAAIAQQLTSCLTEIMFDEALERAKYLDKVRAQSGPVGPLHGLPISIKDTFKVKGHDATIGFVSWIGQKATQNSTLVDVLLDLGAVLYVKTNIPQTLLVCESQNHIFGRTLNPHNTSLTAGGSSGGEGALISFRGSLLGVGTDIGGSIRIPALCCGVYGFKPTVSRVPYGGQSQLGIPGYNAFLAAAGPIAQDFESLELFMRAVLGARPALYESTAFDIPWNEAEATSVASKRLLRIGVLAEDSRYPLHPPVKRALAEAASRLRYAGHEIIQLTAEEGQVAECQEVSGQLLGLNRAGLSSVLAASGEPLIASVAAGYSPVKPLKIVPDAVRKLDPFKKLNALNVLREELQEHWRKIWQDKRLDAVISPSAQGTAVLHDTFGLSPYTIMQNCLDYPAAVIPFSAVSRIQDPQPTHVGKGQAGPNYVPEAQDGAPCSIQVFTNRLTDEKCLAVAKVIDNCLKSKADGSSKL